MRYLSKKIRHGQALQHIIVCKFTVAGTGGGITFGVSVNEYLGKVCNTWLMYFVKLMGYKSIARYRSGYYLGPYCIWPFL